MFYLCRLVCTFVLLSASESIAAGIERIWLTHQTNDPARLVVNWHTDLPGDSIVEFGTSADLGQRVVKEESVTLHHLDIPIGQKGATWHYRVRSGNEVSPVHQFKGYPDDEFRVVVFADTGYARQPWAAAVLRKNPHLLISAGDLIPSLHNGTPVPREDLSAFLRLVDTAPELFRSTPWMAALGNHDREMRPRGPQPPPEPVYDVEATAFREFLALPGNEWHWHFDVPDFGVRFIALDLSHLNDFGTTWQTCHPFAQDSAQFQWYRDLSAASRQPFVVTIYNERNSQVRGLDRGKWGRLIAKGTMAITGFGYFAERAEADGISYYNTSISGTGPAYRDPKSVLLKTEDNFILLTIRRQPALLRADLKNLRGEVLDSKEFSPRSN